MESRLIVEQELQLRKVEITHTHTHSIFTYTLLRLFIGLLCCNFQKIKKKLNVESSYIIHKTIFSYYD